MPTFSIQTLGCKVNQYESEQIATLLRRRGYCQVEPPDGDVRIVNTCSVTVQAASKSRQLVRRALAPSPGTPGEGRGEGDFRMRVPLNVLNHPHPHPLPAYRERGPERLIITGCWATSDRAAAVKLAGSNGGVITHHDDVAAELDRLLSNWESTQTAQFNSTQPTNVDAQPGEAHFETPPRSRADDGWMTQAGTLAADLDASNKSRALGIVNGKLEAPHVHAGFLGTGARSLPLLGEYQTGHQRAFLKVQDGCDAHCTYCIIPGLRPRLWSKPIDDAVNEARRLTASGHVELVLTGIFLGAYGQPTALRRRQSEPAEPIAALIDALCTRVPGLRRLRLSSLEPGDLTADLIAALKSHPQVVPHFHLPLQSGSAAILRRMNRQYTRDDFLGMIDGVNNAFDRPAITTDIIVGFPGETDAEFARTLEVVESARFIHIHAFSFSPRPGTAAARWSGDFVRGPVVNDRIDVLRERAAAHSFAFRQSFVGQTVELLTERPNDTDQTMRHGRCERYFDVHFESAEANPGDLVRVRIDRVTPRRTMGVVVRSNSRRLRLSVC
jgi:MiaB/RimO family radical SAM methylthiotransferase